MDKEIIDSGARRMFSTGATRDISSNKGRCDLMPLKIISEYYARKGSNVPSLIFDHFGTYLETGTEQFMYSAIRMFISQHEQWNSFEDALIDVSKHYAAGAMKYGERNWERGIPAHCYVDSALRHYIKYLRGDDDENHDRAFIWNILALLWTEEQFGDYPDILDLPFNSANRNNYTEYNRKEVLSNEETEG